MPDVRRLMSKLLRVHQIKSFLHQPAENCLRRALRFKERFSNRRDYLFIACMPKSGSTFLANALSELTGYRYVPLAYAYERSEQNLYLPKLIDSYSLGSVTHLHLRATESAIELLNMFSIRPIILVRNIFDVVVSIRDHILNEGFEFPTFYCDESFNLLDEKVQYDFIIEHGLPWYFNFFVSWHQAIAKSRIEGLWLIYDEVISDWNKTLRIVVDFYRINKTDEEIDLALHQTAAKSKRKTRLNKGISGRSRAALTEEQKNKIVSMARFYPGTDFAKIGIHASHIQENSPSRRVLTA
jgi:hypothetical protein